MKKSNISKIIKMFLSARFPSETEEKVQKWIIKDKNQQAKTKASLDFWNELDVEADSTTYASLERVKRAPCKVISIKTSLARQGESRVNSHTPSFCFILQETVVLGRSRSFVFLKK